MFLQKGILFFATIPALRIPPLSPPNPKLLSNRHVASLIRVKRMKPETDDTPLCTIFAFRTPLYVNISRRRLLEKEEREGEETND